LENENQEPEAG